MVDDSTTRIEEITTPELEDGQALVRVGYVSIDPTIRTWMDDAPGYLPPIEIGAVIRSFGIGEVVESRSERYKVGDSVAGMTGWQEYAVADEGLGRMQVLPDGVAPEIALSVLGMTGLTAYFGMTDVGEVKEGDVVVVSGAAGAPGAVAGQIGQIKGAARSSATTRQSTTRPRTSGARCARRPARSTSTSTTSAGRFSKPCSRTSRCGPGSCCAARSRSTTPRASGADRPTTRC
jgi:NADPH:quinone reductase-like Zn-dependent oxidoreductase